MSQFNITNFTYTCEKNFTILTGEISTVLSQNNNIYISPKYKNDEIDIICCNNNDLIDLKNEIYNKNTPVLPNKVTIYDSNSTIVQRYESSRKNNNFGNVAINTSNNLISDIKIKNDNSYLLLRYPILDTITSIECQKEIILTDLQLSLNNNSLKVHLYIEQSLYDKLCELCNFVESFTKITITKDNYLIKHFVEDHFGKTIFGSLSKIHRMFDFGNTFQVIASKSSNDNIELTNRTNGCIQINISEDVVKSEFYIVLKNIIDPSSNIKQHTIPYCSETITKINFVPMLQVYDNVLSSYIYKYLDALKFYNELEKSENKITFFQDNSLEIIKYLFTKFDKIEFYDQLENINKIIADDFSILYSDIYYNISKYMNQPDFSIQTVLPLRKVNKKNNLDFLQRQQSCI